MDLAPSLPTPKFEYVLTTRIPNTADSNGIRIFKNQFFTAQIIMHFLKNQDNTEFTTASKIFWWIIYLKNTLTKDGHRKTIHL